MILLVVDMQKGLVDEDLYAFDIRRGTLSII